MTPSVRQRLQGFTSGMSQPTDSDVVHLRTLRRAIGFIAILLPAALVAGENLRDILLIDGDAGRALVESSISAYFHTGMRELFVGSLCAIAVFLVCSKGPERRDNVAAKLAGACAFLVATFPTPERSREATDAGARAPDSVTFFSDATRADPPFVGTVHFTAAAIFFVTLAVMSLFLFTRSRTAQPGIQKRKRNAVYRTCGVVILVAIALIAAGKLLLEDVLALPPSYVFWLEAVAVVAFGTAWLTKAEVFFADAPGAGADAGGIRAPATSAAPPRDAATARS